jgi:hypothetical protein
LPFGHESPGIGLVVDQPHLDQTIENGGRGRGRDSLAAKQELQFPAGMHAALESGETEPVGPLLGSELGRPLRARPSPGHR